MGNLIEILIGGIIMGIFANCCWKIIDEQKIDFKNYKFYIQILITLFFQVLAYHMINNYIKVAVITMIYAILIKFFYKKDFKSSISLSVTFQILVFVSELIFSIVLAFLVNNDTENIVSTTGTLLANLIITVLSFLLLKIINFRKIYKKLINITEKIKLSNLVVVIILLIISINIFLALPYYEIKTSTVIIINSIMIFIYSFIVFKFVQGKNRYIEISDKYSLTESSLKELQNNINRLMTTNHENKNQLLTIRTMVANKDKNTLKNIDAIIEQKVKDDKFLKEKTSVIANTMLGALIYSKLLNMKDKNINCEFHIDKQITKLDFINIDDKTNVDICKIIGTYLDNTIDASSETEEKEAYINIYIEDKQLFIEISNSFNGIIDFERLNESGYTTKYEGHGYGLALAREIINNNNKLYSETEVNGNIFTQRLKIKM